MKDPGNRTQMTGMTSIIYDWINNQIISNYLKIVQYFIILCFNIIC
jgi:hypothetical protein